MSQKIMRSSAFRLALIYMALFGVSVLILLGFIYWSTAAYMAAQTDATIETEITGLAERYRSSGLTGLMDLIQERLSRQPSGSSIYLLATESFTPLVGNLSRWPSVTRDRKGWLNFRLEEAAEKGGDIHLARARSFRLTGGFHLLVGRDVHDLEAMQQTIARTLIWGLLMTVVLAGIGGTMMSRSTVRRIEAINAASRKIMSGDLSRRIPTHDTGDDFDVLADNLNAMLDRIQGLMEGVRRISDNVAHDLRTPLARLRGHLESLVAQKNTSGADRRLVEQAIAEADGLLATFNALLRIARIETGRRRAAFADLDLAALVRDVAELYEPLAEEKGQRLRLVALAPEVHVRGDRDLLFQAVANLVDNAIKYTPSGGRVDIDLQTDEASTQLSIADSGPGIPEQERDNVFQRFARLEESRTTPGNGLGLSLVSAVAELHGLSISLLDNKPGLRVVCRFQPASHSS